MDSENTQVEEKIDETADDLYEHEISGREKLSGTSKRVGKKLRRSPSATPQFASKRRLDLDEVEIENMLSTYNMTQGELSQVQYLIGDYFSIINNITTTVKDPKVLSEVLDLKRIFTQVHSIMSAQRAAALSRSGQWNGQGVAGNQLSREDAAFRRKATYVMLVICLVYTVIRCFLKQEVTVILIQEFIPLLIALLIIQFIIK